MRRALTCGLIGLATGLGAMLFQVSYETAGAERKLARLNRSIAESRTELRLLAAEWSHLTSPERIAGLAQKHLGFQPMTGPQYATLEDLPSARPPEADRLATLFRPKPKPARPAASPALVAAVQPARLAGPSLTDAFAAVISGLHP